MKAIKIQLIAIMNTLIINDKNKYELDIYNKYNNIMKKIMRLILYHEKPVQTNVNNRELELIFI